MEQMGGAQEAGRQLASGWVGGWETGPRPPFQPPLIDYNSRTRRPASSDDPFPHRPDRGEGAGWRLVGTLCGGGLRDGVGAAGMARLMLLLGAAGSLLLPGLPCISSHEWALTLQSLPTPPTRSAAS